MAENGPLLSMQGLEKRFAGQLALAGASLEVRPGEVHALIGQNGAGKSTLIKVLTGYHRRDAGTVLFEGRPFEAASPRAAQDAGISTIHQEINLAPMQSVAENICLGREPRRFGLLDRRGMEAEAKRLLGRFGLSIDPRRPLGAFSTATQQMVAIARAIGFRARLVVMDEPTSSLDRKEAEVLFGVIRALKADGVSVIYVSHKLDELFEVCDRVTVMRDGRTVHAGPMSGATRLGLVSTMLGRDVARTDGHATGFVAGEGQGAAGPLLVAEGLADGGHVRDVGFEVERGGVTALAGLLGSGRTETAHLAFGSRPAKAGRMTLDGKPHAPRTPADAIAAGLGFVTEDRKAEGIVPDMTVGENLLLALMPRLAKGGVIDRARADELVARFIRDLGVKCRGPGQRIAELSGGNQQKVLLARWLAMDPRLLILDEPTRGIDVGAKAEIQRLVSALAAKGLGVLMISSELEEVVEGADRVAVLRDGATVARLEGEGITEGAVMTAMAEGGGHV